MEFSLKPHPLNKENFFIKGWYIDKKICRDVINNFNCKSMQWKKGLVYKNEEEVIKKDEKNSTDYTHDFQDGFSFLKEYHDSLHQVMNEYVTVFPATEAHNLWGLWSLVNIQRYLPNEGFYKFHSEKGVKGHILKRHLVFMTYLNTIEEGGETEFFHQKIKVKPEEGLTLIWPAEWTYLHRGCIAPKEIKYIITGWFNFV
jgi:hypothetical protein